MRSVLLILLLCSCIGEIDITEYPLQDAASKEICPPDIQESISPDISNEGPETSSCNGPEVLCPEEVQLGLGCFRESCGHPCYRCNGLLESGLGSITCITNNNIKCVLVCNQCPEPKNTT